MVKKIFFFSCLSCCPITIASASIITFVSGKSIEADIVKQTENSLIVNVGGIEVSYPLDTVKNITTQQRSGKPENTISMFKEGLVLACNGKWSAAGQCLRESLDTEHYKDDCLRVLAILEAVDQGRIASSFAPLVFKGEMSLFNGEYIPAVKDFEMAGRYCPDEPVIYYCLGTAQSRERAYEKALDSFGRVVSLDPGFLSVYNEIGLIYTYLGRYREALPCFAKAIELDQDCPRAYNNLGMVYNYLDQSDKALVFFGKAIERDPEYAPAYRNIGLLYADLGFIDRSRRNLEKAKDLFRVQHNSYELEQTKQYLLQVKDK